MISESPGRSVKTQLAETAPPNSDFIGLAGVRPEDLHFKKFPGVPDAAILENHTWDNHCLNRNRAIRIFCFFCVILDKIGRAHV